MNDNMTLNEYQQRASQTSIPSCENISYLALALCGEAGEVAEKVKKIIRDKNGQFYAPDLAGIAMELGDMLWYASVLAKVIGYKLEDIATLNLDKIDSRVSRGVLHGTGDDR